MPLPTFKHEAMATFFEIVIATDDYDYARHAAAAAWHEIDRLETELSRFIENSPISRANRLPRGGSLPIGEEAFECLLTAADVSLATGRAFDPAYASSRPPELAPHAPPFTLDPTTFTLTSLSDRLRLDLGAVGKGYALDRVAQLLTDWNLPSMLLNAGGSSLLGLGVPNEDFAGWPVGVGEGRGHREILLNGASLSASGIAVKGSHLIDPRTGVTATRSQRAWALAPTAAQADALSTAFFIMSEAEVAALCSAHPSIGASLAGPEETLVSYGSIAEFLARGV